MPYGIIFALISMLAFGLGNAMTKTATEKIGSLSIIVLRGLFNTILLLIVFLIFNDKITFSLIDILIAIAIAIFSYLPYLLFVKALKIGKIGVVVPVANSSVVFTVLFSFVFFKEYLRPGQLMALLIILPGIFLISVNFKDFKNSELFKISSGLPYSLITMFLWGLVFALFKFSVQAIGPFLTPLIIEFMIGVCSALHLKISKEKFVLPQKRVWLIIFGLAFFSSIGTLFYNLGIETANISVVSAIASASPLVALLYGKIVYQEKLKAQQYLAIMLILVGVVMMSVL